MQKLIKEADFVVIERAVKNIHPQPETACFLDDDNSGTNVLFVRSLKNMLWILFESKRTWNLMNGEKG